MWNPGTIRWLGSLVIAACIAGATFWGVRNRSAAKPMADGLEAYASGDWESAAAAARRRLMTARDDPAAVRLLARSLSRLERDAVARTMYDRLPDESLEAEDFYLMGAAMERAGDT